MGFKRWENKEYITLEKWEGNYNENQNEGMKN